MTTIRKQIGKNLAICSVTAVIMLVINQYTDKIRTSEQGLALIGNAEGCYQQPYQCPADVLTVGIGSTEASGQKITQRHYSLEEIAARWVRDIQRAEACVNRYANGRNMPQGAFDALTSITFNVGCGKMKSSTLYKMAMNGYSPAMCDQFPRWVYANGKVLKGLVDRRNKERARCLIS
ncbi:MULTISPECIES: lysozyme [Pasteurellaceae]|uniref:Lysozyme n=1 Tax=Avibacterium paragallinarum TaxID=728 RepID=A0AAE5WHK0_AVIPA|nr:MULTISPECIES: lysozyme [Pasteurellaceae]MEE3609031.1 lysozyme [Avibacterium paragallinarum]MEE3621294.1 lysozyme [Avibacterium paragallinarum]MEE3668548.1 lysozyme [Avibacterium paragallinarum]MEE3681237.1 lysozyme [Avibacterium paragallinarum]MEE4386207.1 lysozyme [Avibacterium paragallinarum]